MAIGSLVAPLLGKLFGLGAGKGLRLPGTAGKGLRLPGTIGGGGKKKRR